ncbi:MAG: molybdate ABC transporter substrate-binding protein [Chloroflexi bacterium]|nr:molybdate ABC transporter substrate-binding protein [Chloroflexota bacterium]
MRMGRCLRTVCVIVALSLSIISTQAQHKRTLTIYAATSLTDAFEELAAAFLENHPDADIVLNFASSSKLAAQLLAGAPADIFASANSAQMDLVVADGRISKGAVRSFAANRLVLIAPADNPAEISGIEDLGSKALLLVLAVTGTPIRDYTNAMFDSHNDEYGEDFAQRVLENLVSEESNVRLVVARIALGEADAGIVYQTDVTGEVRDNVVRFPIEDRHNQIASYPVAALDDSAVPELSEAFIVFLRSDDGQSILGAFGFCLPPIKADEAIAEPNAESSQDNSIEDRTEATPCEGLEAEG